MLSCLMQPESPAQLGGKIYEMMGMALSGKWGDAPAGDFQQPGTQPRVPVQQTLEAEVVEPAEAGGQKWEAGTFWETYMISYS